MKGKADHNAGKTWNKGERTKADQESGQVVTNRAGIPTQITETDCQCP
tara:strand:- start:539 stop:682 length:144 start_codon:yes stop_codon:yes gene_type:complete